MKRKEWVVLDLKERERERKRERERERERGDRESQQLVFHFESCVDGHIPNRNETSEEEAVAARTPSDAHTTYLPKNIISRL